MAFAKVIIMGNLGKDPESFTYGADKKTAARFSVAVSSGKGADKKTDWFKCSVFGVQAKNALDYMKKGKSVLMWGRLTQRSYESNGNAGSSLDVTVEDVQLTHGGGNGTGVAAGAGAGNAAPIRAKTGNHTRAPAAPDYDDKYPF